MTASATKVSSNGTSGSSTAASLLPAPQHPSTGIAGDLSLEIGISTGSGDQQQPSGVGFYLRSDHLAHRYASMLLI